MRDTFADTAAARRDLGFRSTVSLREGLAREWEWLRRRTREDSWPLLGRLGLARLRPRRRARHRDAGQQLRPGHLGGRAEGLREASSGTTRASTSAASSTASRRASSAPRRRLALADSYFNEGGTANYILAVSAVPRVPDALSLASQERLRAVPGRRVVLQAAERPRPRPDRHDAGARGVRARCSSSTRAPPRRRRPGSAITELPAEPGPGRVPGRLLLPADPQGLPRRDHPLRRDPEGLPRLRADRRGPVPPGRSASPIRAAPARPSRTSTGCSRSTRAARSPRRLGSSRPRSPPAAAPAPAPSPTPPRPPPT